VLHCVGYCSRWRLDQLALWHDGNGNGRSDAGEVMPLARDDITALACGNVVTTDEESDVAAYVHDGVRFADGSTRPTDDVILHHVDIENDDRRYENEEDRSRMRLK
jgi:hypothetical protein